MQNMKVILIYPHIIRRFPNMGMTMNKVNKFLDKEYSMLVCGQSGCGETIIVMLMLRKPLVYFDKIYLYTRNEPQDKIQDLKKIIDHVSDEVGYDVMEIKRQDYVMDRRGYPKGKRKIVVFYAPDKIKSKIANHISDGRHQYISLIYLSQSYYDVPQKLRLNYGHMIHYPPVKKPTVILLETNI